MRYFGLLVASLLFLSFASFANEDGQAPTPKEQGLDKIGEKGAGPDGMAATGDKKKKPDDKKKPTTPPSNK